MAHPQVTQPPTEGSSTMDERIQRLIERFGLRPHPEGGFFRQVYRSSAQLQHPGVPSGHPATRAAGTLIYFLLAAPEFSAFHRVRWTDEIWHFYAGTPLELHLIHADGRYEMRVLSNELTHGEPSSVVGAGTWQAARVAGGSGFSFCGCSVAPGFEFADFEMPPARELIEAHPEHRAVIRTLTR